MRLNELHSITLHSRTLFEYSALVLEFRARAPRGLRTSSGRMQVYNIVILGLYRDNGEENGNYRDYRA